MAAAMSANEKTTIVIFMAGEQPLECNEPCKKWSALLVETSLSILPGVVGGRTHSAILYSLRAVA
jgi:hypothetical protein